MIKVLVVDDSAVVRRQLKALLELDPDLQVVGEAISGEQALDMVMSIRPDVITMDVTMPGMDGFQTTRSIMELFPTPIVIVTATIQDGAVNSALKAVEAGALACLSKPTGLGSPDRNDRPVRELIRTVKAMAGVKVIRRRRNRESVLEDTAWGAEKTMTVTDLGKMEAVVIGGSTGAPPVLHGILKSLPEDFHLPILIVQHIAPGFLPGMARWLNQDTPLSIQIPTAGQRLLPGEVYIAPDDQHMIVDTNRRIQFTHTAKEYGMRPAASVLFRSAAEVFGPNLLAVLLTGMGKDGAAELGQVKKAGGSTIIQDRNSCVVFGMPGEALRLGFADRILSPGQIVTSLIEISKHQ